MLPARPPTPLPAGPAFTCPVDFRNENNYRYLMRDDETPPPKAIPAPAQAEPEEPPRVRSGDLLGPSGQLEIEHGGRIYRLRVTQQGKLILTA